MTTAFVQRLRRFRRDESAATAVEFAILFAPLVFLILASLQLSLIFFAGQCLQSAAMSSGRQLMTGSAQQAGLTQAQFKTKVCSNAPAMFNCNGIMVDVESGTTFSGTSTSAPAVTYDAAGNVTNSWTYSTGGPGDIVVLHVMYNWPVVAAPLLPGLANQSNGDHLLVATSVFKIEPY
ncbi:MAG TPA: TadE/TadG family type IV pilus assembly protein [Caulobacteraceae bacterium]|jgi:Flp pilus assembly protein TadG